MSAGIVVFAAIIEMLCSLRIWVCCLLCNAIIRWVGYSSASGGVIH